MTKEELIAALKECNSKDKERDHTKADELLIAYINDKDVKAAYDAIGKWYA